MASSEVAVHDLHCFHIYIIVVIRRYAKTAVCDSSEAAYYCLFCFHIYYFVQSIVRNCSVDLELLASSEVADQDLYCHLIHYMYSR